jgi:hypothetical protein
MDTDKKPLGLISLLSSNQLNVKLKPIYPMDDFFVSYVFKDKNNWGNLRIMINILLEAYAVKYDRNDGFHYLDEDIVVETQYQHYISFSAKQPTQDIKIDEVITGDQTLIEFQNKTKSDPPIAIRASNYTGLAIIKTSEGRQNSQILLLAENDDNVLLGQDISNFCMKEENLGAYYPRAVNIMFISLPRLSREDNEYGQLAKLLMGMKCAHLSDRLKGIAEMFKYEFNHFKESEEVVKTMTVLDEMRMVGRAEGREEGQVQLIERMLLKGKPVEDIAEDTDIPLERIILIKNGLDISIEYT